MGNSQEQKGKIFTPVEEMDWYKAIMKDKEEIFGQVKALVQSGAVKYTIEPKTVTYNGLSVTSGYQEWVFPMAQETLAQKFAGHIWDEGASMWIPMRDTKVIQDEEGGTVSVQRFSAWTGPVKFEVDK
jgi:hypothetical protein